MTGPLVLLAVVVFIAVGVPVWIALRDRARVRAFVQAKGLVALSIECQTPLVRFQRRGSRGRVPYLVECLDDHGCRRVVEVFADFWRVSTSDAWLAGLEDKR